MLKDIYIILRNFLFDLLFPCCCLGCGAEGSWICQQCLKTIDIIKQPFCSECRRSTSYGEFCDRCKKDFALDGIFICANFNEGVLKEAIHQYKYSFVFDIGEILGKIINGKLNYELGIMNHELKFDMVVPVPLHKKRKAWRGFNQSEVLGKVIAKKSNIKIEKKILVRNKYTTPQMELDRDRRLENLKDVFEINNVGIDSYQSLRTIQNKNILLVDDITTTGATLEECAKVLKINGAKSVWAIVLAKGK
ncbi:MAG TPA: ComF family protein [Patescibacteria group bacterium]|nr:ComF family protein [Patescibacteria group bacterium]